MVAISDTPIPEHLLDIDFVAAGKAATRLLGCNPRTDQPGVSCPFFGEVFRDRIIPRSDWDSYLEQLDPNFGRLDHYQHDQDGEGTCTGNAGCASVEQKWAEKYGTDYAISLSPPSVYQFCARSANSGSTTNCILKRLRENGAVPIHNEQNRKVLATLELDTSHMIREVGWNQNVRGMEETMSQFRIDEFYEIRNVDEFFSALLYGFPILYGRAGHAIKGTDLVKRAGTYACKYRNSWGQWGDGGYGYDTLDYILRTNGAYGAFAVQTLRAPKNEHLLISAPPVTTS